VSSPVVFACIQGVPLSSSDVRCSVAGCATPEDRDRLAGAILLRVLPEAVYVADVDITDAEIARRADVRPSAEQLAGIRAMYRALGEAAIAVMGGASADEIHRERLEPAGIPREMLDQLITLARTPAAVRAFLARDLNIDFDRDLTAAARRDLTLAKLESFVAGLDDKAFEKFWRDVFALKDVVLFGGTFSLTNMRGAFNYHEITTHFP
jgi:hypothetical protein